MTRDLSPERESVFSFVRLKRNLRLLSLLSQSSRPMEFDDILKEYGSRPPVASLSYSLSEGTKLGVICTFELRDSKRGRKKTYHLTDLGRSLLAR